MEGTGFHLASITDCLEHARKNKSKCFYLQFYPFLYAIKEELPKFLWKLGVFMKIAVTAQHSLT